MKKYSKEDQQLMATWALDCADRVLPIFDAALPNDDRPSKAIEAGREWVRTGTFSMPVIRGASLSAHAAAKNGNISEAATFAAHAAGQAVATAHVSQHAYGSAYYALKAIVAVNPANAEINIKKELDWQAKRLPVHLREEIMNRIITEKRKNGYFISLRKDKDF